ncbi:MAG: HAD-IIA family hydrolase [Chitinispirillaceae bacterium]|nr:HAD-IIA family hydrolase [Chitinispirillaceae bacterium]
MPIIGAKIRERLQKARLFIFDLDGTVYLGSALIPGARECIAGIRDRGIPYVFLTNNSSRSAPYYRRKIARLGIPVTMDNVFTSGQATGMYLARRKPGARIFVLGTRSLAAELASYGLVPCDGAEPVDYVVAGFDTELTYKKLRTACGLIDRGVRYIATNPDYVCPIDGGRSIPDCGSMCFMIEKATGKRPLVIGKPAPDMIRLLCRKFSVPAERTVAVGDRLYTDIAAGKNAGALTLCVLSGEATARAVALSHVKPDAVMESVGVLNGLLRP